MQRRTAPLQVSLFTCLAMACVGGVVTSSPPGASRPGDPGGPMGSGPMGTGPGGVVPPSGPGGTPGPGTGPGNVPGVPGPSGPGGPPAIGMPPTGLPMASPCTNNVPGPRLLRRLTSVELANTLQDLFQDAAVPKTTALADAEVLGFRVDAAQLVVRDLSAQQLSDYAEEVAQWAVTNKLATLSTCATNDAGCRQTFIKAFGRKAFRAPLSDAQVRAYDGLFAAEPTFAEGASTLITAMLQSPNLLYRRELGTPDPAKPGQFVLTPHEVASSLSYLLTQGPPDAQLAQAADMNLLSTPAQLDAQAERLLRSSRGRKTLGTFVRGWLGVEKLESLVKDDKLFPFPEELRKDMLGETEALFVEVFDRSGTMTDLLTAPYSFVNLNLSRFYGVPSAAGGTGFIRVMRPAAQRDPGVLGHASLLATHATGGDSSPVKRGKLVRTRLLCQTLPDPPQDVDTMLKPAMASQTTRQRNQQHTENPACAGCHSVMDPIGFGFERYDGFGRRREVENGTPVDSSGVLTGTSTGEVRFDGVGELAAALAQSQEAKACMVRYWSYFAYGVASWPQDACTQQNLVAEAARSQFSLKSVLMAIIHSPHFTRRVGQ
jgi:hypothetical protein